MDKDIESMVISIIAEASSLPVEQIQKDSSLLGLGIDSLGALSVISDLENEFNLSIETATALEFTHVNQIISYLESALPSG
jgi:acyl carrier protein